MVEESQRLIFLPYSFKDLIQALLIFYNFTWILSFIKALLHLIL